MKTKKSPTPFDARVLAFLREQQAAGLTSITAGKVARYFGCHSVKALGAMERVKRLINRPAAKGGRAKKYHALISEHGTIRQLTTRGGCVREMFEGDKIKPVFVLPATQEDYERMVEQGAKALARYNRPGAYCKGQGWHRLLDTEQEYFINMARATLDSLGLLPLKGGK